IDPEGAGGVHAAAQGGGPVPLVHGASVLQAEGPHEGAAVIAVEVRPLVAGHAAAAVDVAARDGAAVAVRVLEYGKGLSRGREAGRLAEAEVAPRHVQS